ncbi:GntR family transcriptional regulator [Petrotoga halophila]|uniref:GntR family transcriptional regulator n=1 Tax=Petrotoga halophila DSM 16923 TaxID=1122953 RepID=A0A2S5EJS8_9BACT|nr:GntR family transcriptional regulator [Petrotoga halophila]POZ93391.1 GntR family transcriptional regulator [Petrotoga halophila DSM 16923]
MISKAGRSLYKEILKELRTKITKLPEGYKLPSQQELCENLGVSRTLIREVLVSLEREGLIIRKQGLGTFVVKKDGIVQTGLDYLRGVSTIISTSGKVPDLILNEFEEVAASPSLSKKLEIAPKDPLIKIKRVYTADGIPVIYAETYMVINRIPGGKDAIISVLKDENSKNEEIFTYLDKYFMRPIKHAISEIEAIDADKKLANLLKIPEKKAVTLLLEVHYDENNIPLLHSLDYINTSIFKLSVFRRKI